MIEVKQAVAAAFDATKEFYSGQELIGIQLEEIEKSEDGKYWFITLGFFVPDATPPANSSKLLDVAIFQGKKYERKYKVYKIDANNAEVISMKIREI